MLSIILFVKLVNKQAIETSTFCPFLSVIKMNVE